MIKVGDRVTYTIIEGSGVGTVISFTDDVSGFPVGVVVRKDDGGKVDVPYIYTRKLNLNCECGANFNKGFENIHSHWCPEYKE